MNNVRQLYFRTWRGVVLGLSLVLAAYFLYFHRLNTLLPGYSAPEVHAFDTARDWHHLAANPINLPYSLLVWLSAAVLHRGILVNRLLAVTIGLVIALLFFVIVRAWCTYRTALLATLLFVTSSGLLHFARLGTADVLQMSVLALLGVAQWYRAHRTYRVLLGYLLVFLLVLLWYVPGMIWFELLGLIPLRHTIMGQVRRIKTYHLVGLAALFLATLTPLVLAAAHKPRLLLVVVGLPSHLGALTDTGNRLWHLVAALIFGHSGNPLLWVGHAPLLSAVEAVLALLGMVYIAREGLMRRLFLFGSLGVGLVLAALGGAVTFACLVPILYLFVAIGLDNLLKRWMAVFPRNPVARATGVVAVCIALGFSILYQVRSYYVAWPHTPATRAVFDQPAPPHS